MYLDMRYTAKRNIGMSDNDNQKTGKHDIVKNCIVLNLFLCLIDYYIFDKYKI